jgi:uncharacterized membrane protein (UPF0127 family)
MARNLFRLSVEFWIACSLLLAGPLASAQSPPGPQLSLARAQLTAGMHRLDVQLAQTPEQRQIGLMWRKDMPLHEGMLFVFEQATTQCFWMRNTLIPLTAAFVEDDGTIVNLADMQPGLVCQTANQTRCQTRWHRVQQAANLRLKHPRPCRLSQLRSA